MIVCNCCKREGGVSTLAVFSSTFQMHGQQSQHTQYLDKKIHRKLKTQQNESLKNYG